MFTTVTITPEPARDYPYPTLSDHKLPTGYYRVRYQNESIIVLVFRTAAHTVAVRLDNPACRWTSPFSLTVEARIDTVGLHVGSTF